MNTNFDVRRSLSNYINDFLHVNNYRAMLAQTAVMRQ